MKFVTLTAVLILGVGAFPVWGASTRDELVLEVTASLKAHDKVAFEKCVNFEGADEEARRSLSEMEDQVFSWPIHHVFNTERQDEGKAHATEKGKNYTLNGDWSYFINIYVSMSPSKGFVMPAGLVNGKCLILLRTEEKP